MKASPFFILLACLLFSPLARANLCDSVLDGMTTAETQQEIEFYKKKLFPDARYLGNQTWNGIVLECNRRRDTKGTEISKAITTPGNAPGKAQLLTPSLPPKVIRGTYEFLGYVPLVSGVVHSLAGYKYVYVLSKENGVWTMIIPYSAIINDVVLNRIDLLVGTRQIDSDGKGVSALSRRGNGWNVYDTSQVVASKSSSTGFALKSGAIALADTALCKMTTFYPGNASKYAGESDANAYKRDPENKFISLGKIQYAYHKDDKGIWEGCRLDKNQELYWVPDPVKKPSEVEKTTAQKFILDNFVQTVQSFWDIDGVFKLRLLLKGHNEKAFSKATLDLLGAEDRLTAYFVTKFPANNFNQMYKSNLVQFNNFSTMTEDDTFHHEVGHAFGLDDEYAQNNDFSSKDSCNGPAFRSLSPGYVMCNVEKAEVRTIYHYLAVSRYVTKQSECDTDSDCGAGRFCNAGLDLVKNQCEALKPDDSPCAAVGGGHQCQSGHCSLGRCYTPNSVAMGGVCFFDDACKIGKCTSVSGTKGTCVCKEDSDCGRNMWCDGGIDLKVNACRAKLVQGATCGVAGSLGNDHKCRSGQCSGFPKYECR